MATAKITVWHNQNVHLRPQKGKEFPLPSKAIPDQSMSIKEMLEKHSNGETFDLARTPLYTEDSSPEQLGIDVRTLDLVDLQRIKEQNNANIDIMQNARDAFNKEKIAQKMIKDQEDRIALKNFQKEQKAKETETSE